MLNARPIPDVLRNQLEQLEKISEPPDGPLQHAGSVVMKDGTRHGRVVFTLTDIDVAQDIAGLLEIEPSAFDGLDLPKELAEVLADHYDDARERMRDELESAAAAWLDIGEIDRIEPSAEATPGRFCREMVESGMGYTQYALRIIDGRRLVGWSNGGHAFLNLPEGVSPSDISRIEMLERGNNEPIVVTDAPHVQCAYTL